MARPVASTTWALEDQHLLGSASLGLLWWRQMACRWGQFSGAETRSPSWELIHTWAQGFWNTKVRHLFCLLSLPPSPSPGPRAHRKIIVEETLWNKGTNWLLAPNVFKLFQRHFFFFNLFSVEIKTTWIFEEEIEFWEHALHLLD